MSMSVEEKAEKYDFLNKLRFEYHYEPQDDPIFTLGRLLDILEQQKNKLEAVGELIQVDTERAGGTGRAICLGGQWIALDNSFGYALRKLAEALEVG